MSLTRGWAIIAIGLGVFFLVGGCSRRSPNVPAAAVSPEQQKCVLRCKNESRRCDQKHQKIYEQCIMQADEQAKLDYRHYLNQQREPKNRHKKIKKTYRDFLDTQHCKQQLICEADYTACRKNCGF